MGGSLSMLSGAALLVPGSLYLTLLSCRIDWILISIIILARTLTTTEILVGSLCLVPPAFIFLQSHKYLALLFDRSDGAPTEAGRPVLFKGSTTHRRLTPEKHAFQYSYLVAGVPVGWKGRAGGILAVDIPAVDGVREATWFEVRCEDHLHRGGSELGLRGKLDAYLSTEGVNPAKYPYAYLITAPRSLGYSFNPVSFWYLYDETKTLDAVICEVNNTFGERRMYLVTRDESQKQLKHSSSTREAGDGSDPRGDGTNTAPRIQQSFAKDFHVSPFNSRKGTYSIKANDPLGPGLRGPRSFDTTITLCTSENQPKIVARLASLGDPVEPARIAPIKKIKLILGWSWVGFLTFPRIVREAGALWFARRLHVWFRPEPLSATIARRATTAEKALEGVFREYLRHLVEKSSKAMVVKYVPSGIDECLEVMRSPKANGGVSPEELEFRILTPIFYTRFVQYAHDFEAVFAEFRESATISISNPNLLQHILLKRPQSVVNTGSIEDYLGFKTIRWLRRRPPRIVRPLRSCDSPRQPETGAQIVDIRELRLSSMDGYVLAEASADVRRGYISVVARILLADQIAFGSLEALRIGEVILRAGTVWLLFMTTQPILARIIATIGHETDGLS